eukprot:831618-Prorocentrum_minimum.AAC.7
MSSFKVSLEFRVADLAKSVTAEIDQKQFEELLRTKTFKQVDGLAEFKTAYDGMTSSQEPAKRRGRPPAAKPSTPSTPKKSTDNPEDKPKRGRPPKNKEASDATPSKTPTTKGRGRPPKVKQADDAAVEKKDAMVDDETAPKRGRGRPPKDPKVGTKRPSSPSGDGETPAKRGRGRPPKEKSTSEPTPSGAKRGRGRPPKVKPAEEQQTVEKTASEEPAAGAAAEGK